LGCRRSSASANSGVCNGLRDSIGLRAISLSQGFGAQFALPLGSLLS
jgi:hypothetical protein